MSKKMNSMIEQLAVGAIVRLCGEDNVFLKPNIPIGDKEMSYDGGIEIHKDHRESKVSYIARVPVQVKGRTVKGHTKKPSSFRVSLADLKIYLKNNGVLFLKVELEASTNNPKVFYKSLLNLDIQRLLDNSKKDEATIRLAPIKDGKELRQVCLSFIRQQEKQTTNVIGKYSLEDTKGSKGFRLTSVDLVSKDNPEKLLETEYYTYVVDEKDMEWPAGITRLSEIAQDDILSLDLNGVIADFNRKVIYSLEGNRTMVEDVIELVSKPSKSKGKERLNLVLNYDKIKSLKHYQKCLLFLGYMTQNPSFKETSTKDSVPIKSLLEDFRLYEDIFEKAGIPLDLAIYPFKPRGLITRYVDEMKEVFLKGNLGDMGHVHNGFSLNNLKFGDTLLLTLTVSNDEGIKIYMPYEHEFSQPVIASVEGSSEQANINIYIGQDPEILFRPINVTFDLVLKAFSPVSYDYTDFSFGLTNRFALKLINTYDLERDKRYLEIANYIFVNYIDSPNTLDKDITKINHYQCLVRMGVELSDIAIDTVISIREAHPTSDMMNFSCNVLLKNKHDARRTLNRMEREVKIELLTFPIFNLYESL